MTSTKCRDQADTLRQLAGSVNMTRRDAGLYAGRINSRNDIRVISVTSGKGGVGKSNVVVNLAVTLANMGKKVLVIDADLGIGNIDILLGLRPQFTMNHVLSGEKRLDEIIITAPGGIKVVPAGLGVQEYTSLGTPERLRLLDELDRLEENFDVFIIDTEAGISENVTYFNVAAREILVVVSPEPTSITDVYALIKLLSTRYGERHFKVLVNMARDQKEAINVFEKLFNVSDRFLNISLDYMGCVLRDDLVGESVRQQKPVCQLYPNAKASRCFTALARKIMASGGENRLKGNIQFFSRKNFPTAAGLESI
ncbi:MinD/ParA family protein [Geotalea uraniireducens]|uniref:Cobyrinic acid a,c-diamide synthase n=1 Tax=Geotalea uraniireducens (strain Rf4) TaxID=351605 RepID=A5G8Y4_GEOUR|nr:MinD/ParA family protein [Geotalea uraniireducens]ABQ28252.1 Cobyrinic acid a,c-diamide synthase [Geotalea uraniireducens Rf4]